MGQGALGWFQETSQVPKHGHIFCSSASSALFLGVSKCVCSLFMTLDLLQPFDNSHWFSNQLSGFISLLWTPGLGCPICDWSPSPPMEDFQDCDIPLLLCVPHLEEWVLARLLLLPAYMAPCRLPSQPWLQKSFCQSSLCFQGNLCSVWEVSSASSYSTILISSKIITESFLKMRCGLMDPFRHAVCCA